MDGMKTFLNVSNHPSHLWAQEQKDAAFAMLREDGSDFGVCCISDQKFPNVNPEWTAFECECVADDLATKILADKPVVAMVSGEQTVAFRLCALLRAAGVRVVCATTKRETVETAGDDGSVTKTAVFKFVQFRDVR